jgi:2-oxoacid:acceptor oxidoreductase delta subunit (pyruvate/2-ketoisovalerate family)
MELHSAPEYEKLIWAVVHCRGVLHTAHGNSFVRTLATAGTVAGRESNYYMRYDDSPERDNVPMMFYAVMGNPKIDVSLHEEVEPISELFNAITVMDSSILLHKTSQRALIFDGAKKDAVLVVNTSLPPAKILEVVEEEQLTNEWTGKIVTVKARSYDVEIAYPLLGALLKAWKIIKLDDLSTALVFLGKADKMEIVERAYSDAEPAEVNVKAKRSVEKKSGVPKAEGRWDLETYRKYQTAASKAPTYRDRMSAMPSWKVLAPGLIEFGPKPGEKNIGFATSFDRYMRPVIDVAKCTDCKMCHHYCPDGAISFDIKFDFDYCTGCGICEKVCPLKAISMVTEWEKSKGVKEEEIVTVEQALREYGY